MNYNHVIKGWSWTSSLSLTLLMRVLSSIPPGAVAVHPCRTLWPNSTSASPYSFQGSRRRWCLGLGFTMWEGITSEFASGWQNEVPHGCKTEAVNVQFSARDISQMLRLPPFPHTTFSRVQELILQGLNLFTLNLISLLRWSHWSYNIRVMTSWSYNLT